MVAAAARDLSVQRVLLGGGEPGVRHALAGAEQADEEPLGGEVGPQAVERRLHGGLGAQVLAQVGEVALVEHATAERLGGLLGQRVQDVTDEDGPGLVVRAAAARGAVPGRVAGALVQPEGVPAEVDVDRPPRHPLAVVHGLRHHVGHPDGALDLGGPGGLARRGGDPGVQLGDRGQQDVGLAQGGQHLLDVAQEGEVRADDQHAPARQPLAVGVEQVGGAVQGDDGLACARTPLHHQHAVEVAADDAVLLALDGGHDVAHAPGALLVQGGQQGRLAVERGAVGLGQPVEVEQVIVDADDAPSPGLQMAPAGHAHRDGGRGAVERLGHRGAPVDEEPCLVVVRQAQAADIEGFLTRKVEAPETQAVLDGPQPREALGVHPGERVALGAVLVGAATALGEHAVKLLPRARPQQVEPLVEPGDVFLLLGELDLTGSPCFIIIGSNVKLRAFYAIYV